MGGACSLGPKHIKNPITKHSFIYTPSSHSSLAKKNRNQNANKNTNFDTQDDHIEKYQKQQICYSETEVHQLNKRVNQQVVDAQYYKIGRYFMEEGTIKSEEQVKGTQKWKQFLDDGQITLNKLTKQKRLEIFPPNHPEVSLNEIEKSLAVSIRYSQKMTKLDFFLTKGFVPQQDRWSAWKTKVGVFVYFQKDIYDNLKNQDCPCLKNILKDVGRTFVGQSYFKVEEKKQQPPQLTQQSLREFQKEIEEKNRLENTKQLAQQDYNQRIVGSEKYEDEFAGENSPTGKNCQSNDGSRVNYRRIDLSENNYQSPILHQQQQIVFQQQKPPSAAATMNPKTSSDEIHQVLSHQISSVGQESLHRVLRALSNYFPQLKYTQGMNFIIGFFLLLNGGDEEEAFWMFVSLAQNENFLIMGLYENSFPLIDILKFMLEVRLKSSMPELHYHIRENLEIIYEEWFFQWAITLFLDKFALKEAIRFWDYIISEGTIFSLISLSLSILKELKNKILQVQDHGEFHELFNRLREDASFMDSNEKQLLSVEAILNGARKLRLDKKVILDLAKEYIISQNPVIQNTKQRINIYSCYLSSKDQSQAVKTLRRGMQLRIQQNIQKMDIIVEKSPAGNEEKNKNDFKDTQSDERRVIQKPMIDSLCLDPYYNLKKHLKSQAFSVDGEEDIKHSNQQPIPKRNRGLLPPIKQGRNRANLLHFPDESNEPAKNKLKTITKTDNDYPHKDSNDADDDHSSLKGIENRQYDCNSIINKQSPLPPLNIRWNSLSNRKEKDRKLFSETHENGVVTNIDNEYNQPPLDVDNIKHTNMQEQEFNNSKGAFFAAKQLFHSPHNIKKTIHRANSQSFQTTQESSSSVGKNTKILLNQQLFYKQDKESRLDGLISRNKEFEDDFNCFQKGIKHTEVQSYSVYSSRRQSFNSQGKEEVQKKKSSQLMIGSAQGTPQQTTSQIYLNYTSNDTKLRLLSNQQSQQTTPLQQQFQSETITNKEFCLISPAENKGDLNKNNAMKRQLSGGEQHSGSSSRKKNKFIKINHPQVPYFKHSVNYQPDLQVNSFAVENDIKQKQEQRLEGIQDQENRTKELFNNKDLSDEQSNSQNEANSNSRDHQQDKDSHKDSNSKKSNDQDTDSTLKRKDIENNNANNQSASQHEESPNPQSQNDNSCVNLEYHEADNCQENQFPTRESEYPTERRQQGRQSVISGQREGINLSGYINNLHPQNISGFSEHLNSVSAAQLGQISQTKKDLSMLQIHSPTHSTGQRRRTSQVEDNEQKLQNKQENSSDLHDEKVKLAKESTTLYKNTKNQLEQSPMILFDESVNSIQMSTARCPPLPQFTPRTERREQQQQLPPKINSQASKNNSKGSIQAKCCSLSHIGKNLVQNSNSQPKSIPHLLQNEENNNKHASNMKLDNQCHKILTDNSFSEELERVQASQQQQQSDKFNNFMNSGQQYQLGMAAPSASCLQQIEEEICVSSDKQLPPQYPVVLSLKSRNSTNNHLNNSSHMSSKTNESQHSKHSFTQRDKLKHDINLPQNQQTVVDLLDKTCIDSQSHAHQKTLENHQIIRSFAQKNILNNSLNHINNNAKTTTLRSQSIHTKGYDLIRPQISRSSSKQQKHKSSASEDLKAIATVSQC